MAKFPKLRMFEGINAPSRIEVDIHDLEVEGDIRSVEMASFKAQRFRSLCTVSSRMRAGENCRMIP